MSPGTTRTPDATQRGSSRWFLTGVFLLALGLRLALGWSTSVPDNDERSYWNYSGVFLEFLVSGVPDDPSSSRPYWFPPGIPGLLAVWRWIAGDSLGLARILMHVLASCIPLAVWWWARGLLSESGARLAALLAALDPYMVLGSGRLESDHVFTLLMVLVLLTRPLFDRSPLVTGILCGLLAWVRTATLFFIPFIALEIWRRHGWRRGVVSLLFLVAGYVMAVSPLLVRNRVLVGEWFLAPYQGFVLLSANNPNHARNPWVVEGQGLGRAITYNPTSSGLADDQETLDTLPFLERDSIYRERALGWLRDHPWEYPLNAVHRVLALFHFYPPAHPDLKRLVPLTAMTLMILMAFHGLAVTWSRPEWAWCRVVFAGVVLTAALTMVIPRYRFPLHPVFYVLSIVSLQRLTKRSGSPDGI